VWLIALLSVSIGLPFFVLSATAPLLQKWFAHTDHRDASNPYFLYAASNLGSIIALLAYPVLFEPFLGLTEQSRAWTIAYGGLGVLMAASAFMLRRSFVADAPELHRTIATELKSSVDLKLRMQWVILAFIPSSLLLGVTNHITTDIASVPLFWVVPLALFLLTFVIVFSKRPAIKHNWIVSIHAYLVVAFVIVLYVPLLSIRISLFLHLVMFFVTAMLCHGELAKRRPATSHLTEFYLWMSFGGVLGGAFNALAAPVIFNSNLEYPIAIVLACALRPVLEEGRGGRLALDFALPMAIGAVVLAVLVLPDTSGWIAENQAVSVVVASVIGLVVFGFSPRPLRFALGIAVLLVAMNGLMDSQRTTLLAQRNFFGVHTVKKDDSGEFFVLKHGTTTHGAQSVDPQKWRDPLTYFTREGPAGQIFADLHTDPRALSVGIVGLGVGTMACFRRPVDEMTFYEIDAAILSVALDDRYFHYLEECAPDSQTILGDARLSLAEDPSRQFDLLIIDAFSSDSIPVHLITREAIDLYLELLEDDGLLLIHISNRYMNLEPVLGNLSQHAKLAGRIQRFFPVEKDPGADPEAIAAETRDKLLKFRFPSTWVVLARNEQALGNIATDQRWSELQQNSKVGLWTDDYSNIVRVLQWGKKVTSD
jgi:spermidine synthase